MQSKKQVLHKVIGLCIDLTVIAILVLTVAETSILSSYSFYLLGIKGL